MNSVRPKALRRRTDEEDEGFLLRLVAAMIAAPLFEMALFLALWLATGRGAGYLFLQIPLWVHGLYAVIAVGVALLFGFRGITWLMGHLFWTHMEGERNELITAALWAIFAVMVAIGFFGTRL